MLRPPQNPNATVGVRDLSDADRDAISQWRYDGALAVYSPGPGAHELRAPDHVALTISGGALIGYGTAGREARVPGGLYPDVGETVDLGLGLRPDLVGLGHGAAALAAVIEWATHDHPASRLRATVAAANRRAAALVEHAGFVATHRFLRARDDRAFVQYERRASETSPDGA